MVKVAVSIPDAVFKAAERLAEQRRCSRSSLYAEALEHLLAYDDAEEVTARLDALYFEEPSEIAPSLLEAQRQALTDRWRSAAATYADDDDNDNDGFVEEAIAGELDWVWTAPSS